MSRSGHHRVSSRLACNYKVTFIRLLSKKFFTSGYKIKPYLEKYDFFPYVIPFILLYLGFVMLFYFLFFGGLGMGEKNLFRGSGGYFLRPIRSPFSV